MDKSAKALTWTELRVGAVTLVSLVVLAATILYIGAGGGTPLAPRYELRALMSDVNGLKAGAPVRVGGVEVGTVTLVDFGGERARGMVEVEMKIDRRVKDRVTTESQATLGSLGLLGEKAVEVPLSVMRLGDGCWMAMLEMAEHGNFASRSDLEVGAKALETGIWGAGKNVLVNLPGIDDAGYRERAAAEVEALSKRARTQLDQLLAVLARRAE